MEKIRSFVPHEKTFKEPGEPIQGLYHAREYSEASKLSRMKVAALQLQGWQGLLGSLASHTGSGFPQKR